MSPTTLRPPHVDVVVACASCSALRQELDNLRRLLIAKETRLDAERRHSADLEQRLLRHLPTWERDA